MLLGSTTVLNYLLLGLVSGTVDDPIIHAFHSSGQIRLFIVDIVLPFCSIESSVFLVFRV